MFVCLLLAAAVAAGAGSSSAPPPRDAPEHWEPAAHDRPPPSITFDEALGLSDRAPSVEGAREAASAHADLAGRVSSLTSNPELRIEPGYRLSASADARTRVEGTASLSQSWSLAGLGGRRRAAVAAEGRVLVAEARATSLARRLAAAQAWIDLWAAQAALADARQEVGLAGDLAAQTDRGAAAALLTRADASDAAAYRAEARLLALSVEGEATDLGFRLARESARPPVALATRGELPHPPLPPAARWDDLVARAGALPEVTARRLAAHADAARAAEARAGRGTQLATSVAIQRDNRGEYVAFAGLGFTLPVFDRGEREAAPFSAAAARGQREAEDAAQAASAELARDFHEVEHTGEVLVELEAGFLPASREAARLREVAFQAGDATVLEVLVSRRSAAAARARLQRARAAHAWARVKVWLELAELARADGGVP